MAKTQKTVSQRIARVSKALTQIAAYMEKKPAPAARRPLSKRALDEGRREPGEDIIKQVAPATNAIDDKMTSLDKMISGLLAAINRGNVNNVKSLLKNVVKKIQEIEAVSEKSLKPLVASAKTKAAASEAKARVDRKLRRAKAVARRGMTLVKGA